MDCQRYENWLTDAALGALSPSHQKELGAHLAECAICEAQLERERRLLAAIDSGLAESLDVQLPPGFAARVRVRLAEETATERSWVASWVPLAAGATVVAVLAIVGWMSWRAVPVRRQESRSQESGVRSQKAEGRKQKAESKRQESEVRSQRAEGRTSKANGKFQMANGKMTTASTPDNGPLTTDKGRSSLVTRHSSLVGGRRHTEPELRVLVDKSQWQAIVWLYNDAQSGRVNSASLVTQQNEDTGASTKPIEIKPLEVTELSADLKPLDSGVGR